MSGPTITIPADQLPQEVRKVETWEDADRALLALRVTEARISMATAKFDESIQALEEAKSRAVRPLVDRKERMEALLEEFINRARATIKKGAKSQKLVHGVLGFRLGQPSLRFTESKEHTKKLLKIRGHSHCIVVREELDKKAARELPETERALCGMKLVQSESWFYKLHQDPPISYPEVEVSDDEA